MTIIIIIVFFFTMSITVLLLSLHYVIDTYITMWYYYMLYSCTYL